MLDTNICWYIMRNHDPRVLENLQACVQSRNQIVISVVTYAEMRFGSLGKKASKKLPRIIDEFVSRLDSVIALDKHAIDMATTLRAKLTKSGELIGYNDSLIAGHALSLGAVLVTNNLSEFSRVKGLKTENWL